jgi:5-methylcytosine-specific restriction endonuclease McrA
VFDATRFKELIAAGASVTRISHELGLSRYSVKRTLEREGLQTERAHRLDASRRARAAGTEVIRRRCWRHGDAPFARDTGGTFRCTRCSSEAVSRRRRKLKAILVTEAGGRCALCGYDRYVGALAFHHIDPAQKSFGLAEGGLARSLAKSREEVAKCALLCANCHAEVEAGVTRPPALRLR